MKKSAFVLLMVLMTGFAFNVFSEEPELPDGLIEIPSAQPVLPSGLDEHSSMPDLPSGLSTEPSLPSGLDENKNNVIEESDDVAVFSEPLALSGFWEARLGARLQEDQFEDDLSISETRLQLDIEQSWSDLSAHLVTDFIYDSQLDSHDIDLESGQGWLDLRELNFTFSPLAFLDIKAGRQILTWGTGDLLFINDLFPKDWNAFFIGRDQEYLKAPSDAIKFAFFTDTLNVDFVYIPRFDADRFIDGKKVSYFNPFVSDIVGQNAIVQPRQPDRIFSEDEFSLRLYRNIGANEVALYGYSGYWKSPVGFDPLSSQATFPELNVYGASMRGPVSTGIGHFEVGYYDSSEDAQGKNSFIPNSEFRVLIGYEQEVIKNLTLSGQYYLEHMIDYQDYQNTLPTGFVARDKNRHLFTMRLRWLTHEQNMIWSLFAYASPSDKDYYLRPSIQYKFDDHWNIQAGGNIFGGEETSTFFGQFEDNTNVYASIRYGF